MKKQKTVVEIYESWCKKCGICAAFCPAGVLAQSASGKVVIQDAERCTGCQLCELRCPDFAIHVRPAKEKGKKSAETKGKQNRDLKEQPEKT